MLQQFSKLDINWPDRGSYNLQIQNPKAFERPHSKNINCYGRIKICRHQGFNVRTNRSRRFKCLGNTFKPNHVEGLIGSHAALVVQKHGSCLRSYPAPGLAASKRFKYSLPSLPGWRGMGNFSSVVWGWWPGGGGKIYCRGLFLLNFGHYMFQSVFSGRINTP
jgi:hypothetical protein